MAHAGDEFVISIANKMRQLVAQLTNAILLLHHACCLVPQLAGTRCIDAQSEGNAYNGGMKMNQEVLLVNNGMDHKHGQMVQSILDMKVIPVLLLLPVFHLASLEASDLLVDGALRVTGAADIEGNIATIGSWQGDPAHAGLSIQYVESSGASIISMDASRSDQTWLWRRESGSGLVNSMQLGATHVLTLLQGNGTTAGVVLDPSGASTFLGSIIAHGSDSRLPSQTLLSEGSIVTRSLGDARYLKAAGSTLVYGTGSSATAANSIALGGNAVATGTAAAPSIAIGTNVTATTSQYDLGSVAIGWEAEAGDADRGGAVSIGYQTKALGFGSVSMGFQANSEYYGTISIGTATQALEGYAVAIGLWAHAEGYQSKSIGGYTVAKGFAQTVMGYFNVIDEQADKFNKQPQDKLFVIGNGTDWQNRSNALEVKWNGETTVHGDVVVKKELKVEEGARFEGPVRVAPGGGLSMGQFTFDPEQQP